MCDNNVIVQMYRVLIGFDFSDFKKSFFFQNTLNEITRLAKFYGLEHSDDVLKDISANCQFDAMKKRYTQTDTAAATIRFKEGAGFFRKGMIFSHFII